MIKSKLNGTYIKDELMELDKVQDQPDEENAETMYIVSAFSQNKQEIADTVKDLESKGYEVIGLAVRKKSNIENSR